MKKLDKLILGAFLGPFILTFIVVVFIMLVQFMLTYLDELVGKGLGLSEYSELLFYFSLVMVPKALPLSILLSSLMTFGNLGEHHELTAIKSSGISLTRMLMPIGFIIIALTFVAFYFSNTVIPKANLSAFSLLYDIRQKKPSLDFKEGAFYKGLPGYSIKVNKKFPDGQTLKGIMIYDHTANKGNTDVILADSGKMYTFNEDTYLALELFKGQSFSEQMQSNNNSSALQFVRNKFTRSKLIFSLASFDFTTTNKELFASNKLMKNVSQLDHDKDSLRKEYSQVQHGVIQNIKPFYNYSYQMPVNSAVKIAFNEDSLTNQFTFSKDQVSAILTRAANQARSIKSFTASTAERLSWIARDANAFEIEKYRKYTLSIACFLMFLIGAPLGAIIKKGGFGIPVLISIVFFILYYVFSIMGEKWAKEGVVSVPYGMWASNIILFPIGLWLLNQARNDTRILDLNVIQGAIQKIFKKKKLVTS